MMTKPVRSSSMNKIGQGSVKSTLRNSVDVGFQTYMLNIYKFMSLGLVVTACVALALANLPLSMQRTIQSVSIFSMFGTLGIALYMSYGFARISVSRAYTLFWVYSALMGSSFFWILRMYSARSLAMAFFSTSALFGITTVYGFVTKKDLTSMGSIFYMGVLGLIAASVVNLFIGSSVMDMAISALSVVIFTGLIAYQTQALRQIYYSFSQDEDLKQKMAIMGALNLYTSVVNLFLSLLRLMSREK